jgi:hypothetical protein
VTVGSENGILYCKIVGASRVIGEEAGMVFAEKLMAAAAGKPGGLDRVNMVTSKIIIELSKTTKRRNPVPTYKERITNARINAFRRLLTHSELK